MFLQISPSSKEEPAETKIVQLDQEKLINLLNSEEGKTLFNQKNKPYLHLKTISLAKKETFKNRYC